MDFYEEASLVMVPSGYKDQKVYSSVPDDGSGDLTFSRASTATRVNSDGYIEKAQVNLLLQSNSFDTTWTNVSSTETGGQSGYDGTNDAYKLDISAAGGRIAQPIVASGVLTASVYVKAGTLNWVRLLLTGSNTDDRYFNLSNGTLGGSTYSGGIDSKIEAVGSSGWYRISFTHNDTTATLRFYPAQADGDLTATSGNIYIQDAQLNYGLVAQDYIETTTASVTEGVAIDVPRLNYDPVNPTSASLLLEPSRTNLINHSEYFGGHTLFASNVATNSLTSPEGVLNGSEVRANSGINLSISTANGYTAGASAYVAKNVGTLTASTYTFSTFVKKTDLNLIQLRAADDSDLSSVTGAGAIIDLDTYTVVYESNCTTTIEPYALGWYRISITFTATATTWYAGYWYWNKTSITVDGTQGYGVYGSQLELGSYESSLIPTYGSSATRTADACSKTGISSLIGQTEGVLYIELEGVNYSPTGGAQFCSLDDGTSSKRMELFANTSNFIGVYVQDTSSQVNQTTTVLANGLVKIALAYKLNDYALYINGTLAHTDTSATVPTVSALRLFGRFDGLANGSQGVKQALLFKTRLLNSDLATLTSL